MSSDNSWKIIVEPGLADYDEPITRYKERTNYGPHYTDYTFYNEYSARQAMKAFEENGYIVRLYDPDGNSVDTTNYGVVHSGITIK
jgi:hypothetical protein